MSTGPRWQVEGRDWPNRAHSRFVNAAGLHWHVQIMGPEDAPVLLLLHGTGTATHSWRKLAPLLATRFRVVAPDLPGHGFTTGRPVGGLTMTGMARALGELMTVLGLDAAIIAGHSAGAAIAIRMVLDGHATPRAIVGLNAALLPFPGVAGTLFPSLAKLLFVNPLAPHVYARMARVPGGTARFLARSTGSRIDAEGVACYERLLATPGHCEGAITMMANWDLPTLKRDLARLRIPLLMIHGAADPAIPLASAREAAALIGTARLASLPGLGHNAHEEKPDDVASLMTGFAEEMV
jgi:magnesium chelatase accessory protein